MYDGFRIELTDSPDPGRLPVILEKMRSMVLSEPNFTPAELATFKAPTLILDGQDETVIRTDHPQEIAESLPNATLFNLPNAGRAAVAENPELWNNALLIFFNRPVIIYPKNGSPIIYG